MSRLTRREALRLAAVASAAAALRMPLPAFAGQGIAFDDGNTDVPGEVKRDLERVVIIGAGWAGLTVANALRTAGVDHVVLEARDRVGGRARTVDLGGLPMDLGCSWIHQPIGNPMTQWASAAGVGTMNGDVEMDYPIIRFFDGSAGGEVGATERLIPIGHFVNFAQFESASLAEEHPGISVQEGWELYAGGQSMSEDDLRRASFMARGFSEMVYGKPWDKLSLGGWSWGAGESDYVGVGEGNFPVGGYRELYGAMARGGEQHFRFSHRVQSVDVTQRCVKVKARAGHHTVVERGSHVVCTVPLGVLKRNKIDFSPGLPLKKRDAIAHTGFGNIEKVAMVFEDAFWNDPTHTHILHLAESGELAFPWWIDMQRTHQVPALMAFNGGPFARKLHGMTAVQRRDRALDQLSEILGYEVPRPIAWKTTDWQGDPCACGSYSATLKGRTRDDLDVLAAPLHGRLLFAGEATSRTRHSTADGAMTTGIREA
ncbi:MAG TPA: FAD-dependent oxidoreductase, partial [Solirubrobacterales bacterium]|nr:FAD-dependent oxidoreductase [Solirubrobacterales bacterium]